MKTYKASFFLGIMLLFFANACKEKTPRPNPALASINLLRGELVICSSEQFGDVSFSLSCSYETQETFDLALSLLHSFEYAEAEKAFVQVIDMDPDCAMAYWGVSMSIFHTLWMQSDLSYLAKGQKLLKIAKTLPMNDREKDYIDAISIFYKDWDKLSKLERQLLYETKMEALHNKYKEDTEAAVLYALAIRATANPNDKTFSKQKKAGKILDSLFVLNPNHPGVAHYIIHNYDYPELAHLALATARRYANIAPASAHAQHMPSHIFTRLGLWEESINSNLKSTSSAQCYAEQVGMDGNWDEEIHGTDYLVYAYLQLGKVNEAKDLVDYLISIKKFNKISTKVAYPSAAIPSRFYIETRQWDKASKLKMPLQDFPSIEFPWANGLINFTRILGAVHSNDIAAAKKDLEKLSQCHEYLLKDKNQYIADQVLVMVKAAEAWIQFFEGNKEDALTLMKASAEIEMNTDKHPVTPGEVLPADELLGDMLLLLNKPKEALIAYEVNLKGHPNRFNGLYGAAIAAKQSGNQEKATMYFEQLLKLTENSNSDRIELIEAREFIDQKAI